MLSALRHRVTLKKPTRTYRNGSWTSSFEDEAGWVEVWAAVQPLSSRERALYAQLESSAETRVIIRPTEGFTDTEEIARTDWRIGIDGEDHEIVSARNPDLRGRMLALETRKAK